MEDETLINLATADLLEEMGCRVTAVMQLEDAFTALEHERPDLA